MRIHRAKPLQTHHLDEPHPGLLDRLFHKTDKENGGFNCRMFEEDFVRIFSYADRHNGKLFDVLSNDKGLAERLLSNFQDGYGPYPPNDAVRAWVNDIAHSVVRSGTAYYYLQNDVGTNDVHVEAFGPNGIVHLLGVQIQWVPKRIRRKWDRSDEEVPREIRILSSARVMRFVIPTTIKRMISAQKRTLAVIDKHQFSLTDSKLLATYENPKSVLTISISALGETRKSARCIAPREPLVGTLENIILNARNF